MSSGHRYFCSLDESSKKSLGHLPVLHDGGNNQNLADRPRRPKPKIDPSDSVVTFHPQMRYSFTYTQYDRYQVRFHAESKFEHMSAWPSEHMKGRTKRQAVKNWTPVAYTKETSVGLSTADSQTPADSAAQGLRVMGPRCSQNRVPRYLKGRLEPSIRTTVPKTVKDTEGHAGDEEIAHVVITVHAFTLGPLQLRLYKTVTAALHLGLRRGVWDKFGTCGFSLVFRSYPKASSKNEAYR
ncbi:hypothetical protein P692DRAFT_20816412 [Suillus brevipes Sb2]|nr:hypothetical protein P692DRAFT_20816412 [Suillus brevipes Sb2]